MIISRIVGGIGNQMFQYAMGRSLAIASGQQFKLDLSSLKKYKLRDYELNQFCIKAQPLSKWEQKIRQKYSSLAIARTLVSAASCLEVREEDLTFKQELKGLNSPAYLVGYWQSEKYFNEIAGQIRHDFSLKSEFTPARSAMHSKIKASADPVSVHVRRGDYVTNPRANAIHGTCEPDWYAAAMMQMQDQYDNLEFFVFSDDIAWSKANLPDYPATTFVEPQGDGRDVEDIHLMAACKSHIVANSSFSWWGAWLNPRPNKKVIAPRKWFRSAEMDARDLIPDSWQKL
ncbi:hypothetical protein IWQ55_002766 [Labrenzia sp. EL_208]|nr:hypothetical protein [Labrenzia sp. EL_132]MBG6229553.1 hypothetical protein [Labrenzia sp. EL_208]